MLKPPEKTFYCFYWSLKSFLQNNLNNMFFLWQICIILNEKITFCFFVLCFFSCFLCGNTKMKTVSALQHNLMCIWECCKPRLSFLAVTFTLRLSAAGSEGPTGLEGQAFCKGCSAVAKPKGQEC